MADFDYALPHLAGVQVIRMDYRGRGASDWAAPASYTVLQEAQDALALLDHLGVAKAAILGTSRGGLIGMVLGQLAKPRLTGLCLNDIGPVIERAGLQRIGQYVGRNPAAGRCRTMPTVWRGPIPVSPTSRPPAGWPRRSVRSASAPQGVEITYDPALRDGFLAGMKAPPVDLWPLFDALAGLPLAAIRGANSDLLSAATLAEMQRRRPDMIAATVPDRGHVPFLDEPQSLTALAAFVKALP